MHDITLRDKINEWWDDNSWWVFLLIAISMLVTAITLNNHHTYMLQEAEILAKQQAEQQTVEYPEDFVFDDRTSLEAEEKDICSLIANEGYQVLHITEQGNDLIFTIEYPGLEDIYTKKNEEGREEAENKMCLLFAKTGEEIPVISKNCQIIFCVVSDLETETVKFMVENEGISYTCFVEQPRWLPGESEIDLAEWEKNIEGITTDYLTIHEE